LTEIVCVVCPPGLHRYVPDPEEGVAVRLAVAPAHIVGLFTDTVGAVVTVTFEVAVAVAVPQPEEVYVTV
jgi:hypothetical protein